MFYKSQSPQTITFKVISMPRPRSLSMETTSVLTAVRLIRLSKPCRSILANGFVSCFAIFR